jgi:hypothetical protein
LFGEMRTLDESGRISCGTTARAADCTADGATLELEDGCTNGACIAGIVLQQSSLAWPCDEQAIDRQHSTACSCVIMAEQSNA